MNVILNKDERESFLTLLTEQQRTFLMEHVKRGKKTVFANEMAKDKGIIIPDHATSEEVELLLEEWILENFIDNGFVNPDTPCECGRPLRYQYIVKHKSTNEIRRFGITHFEEHTGIPAELVHSIKKGFSNIDYELDEILQKVSQNWDLSREIELPLDMPIPKDIQEFLSNNIPLLERQIKRLKTLSTEFLFKQELKQEDSKYELPSFVEHEIEQEDRDGDQTTFEFDLFEEPKVVKERVPLLDFKLSNIYREAIIKYVDSVSSARIITELLIKNEFAPKERYSTGKPKIYPQVCMFLDSLVYQGVLQLTNIDGRNDRTYLKI